ncbi:hypothetical protein QQP08_019801 [Theobroma cacao]|nr:hypothetical protein QQP08_019801 [Theobroma cacao]
MTGGCPYGKACCFVRGEAGHRNGAQYGAPFREEDLTDDEEVIKEVSNSPDLPTPTFTGAARPCFPQSQCLGSPAESSHFAASPSVVLDANKSLTPMEASQVLVDDSISAMLSSGQSEDYSPVAIANDNLEIH